MLISTVFIVATHLINACYSTRLPLEVYELTPSTNNNNPAGVTTQDLKHKNLEYSTINSAAVATATSTSSSSSSSDSSNYFKEHHVSSSINDPHHPPEQVDLKILSSKEHTQTQLSTNLLDRRRSRQMLDLLKTHHDLTGNYNKLHTLQMQLPTTTTIHNGGSGGNGGASSNIAHNHNGKDVRILYQVGDSEDDLPICAPNAVCSKIDLYETPWIERQCRCPSINRAPEIIIHHHHKDSHSHQNHNTEKYHSYYEHSKILHQNKHLLLDAAGFGGDKKYDSIHLKKLMHKLGAVYEDDINLPSDYVLHEENSALASNEEGGALLYSEDINDNEFPHLAMKRQQQQEQHHLYTNSAHMRHSGHMGHQEKLTYIGGCPSGLGVEDGHTIADKTRHYKLCQPVHRLPVCRHFRDYTWTLTTSAEVNSTEQIVHCRCPKNSVTYLTKREPLDDGNSGYKYLFACSPLTRLRCQRKQPCKLFTVRKRQEFIDEVNINDLCQCPKGHHCPSHHTQSGVIAGETFLEDNIQTYSGYCMAND